MQFAIIAKVPSHNSSLHAENKKLHRKSEYCGRIDVILIKISFHFVHTVCTVRTQSLTQNCLLFECL